MSAKKVGQTARALPCDVKLNQHGFPVIVGGPLGGRGGKRQCDRALLLTQVSSEEEVRRKLSHAFPAAVREQFQNERSSCPNPVVYFAHGRNHCMICLIDADPSRRTVVGVWTARRGEVTSADQPDSVTALRELADVAARVSAESEQVSRVIFGMNASVEGDAHFSHGHS